MSQIRELKEFIDHGESLPPEPWQVRQVKSEDCLSYVAWNVETKEAVVIDPKREDLRAYLQIAEGLRGYSWVAVIDTHTHADHITCAPELSQKLGAPLVMHKNSPTQRAHLKVQSDALLNAKAGSLNVFQTPGHTPDSVTVLWGPYIFGGDTLLYGDVGRDDLPGGNATDHFESIEKLKSAIKPEQILLPGHDHKGGRASTWKKQLQINVSLTQSREDFVREAEAFDAPAPALLKASLRENFK